jgi:Ethanolamine utilization protein EutJ (predicted chaperonin)
MEPSAQVETPQQDSKTARYSVGIDLGTTHCVISYLDLEASQELSADEVTVNTLEIPQLSKPGVIEEHSQLPSFVYQAHEAELSANELTLPWSSEPKPLVGMIARELGSKTPIRLVASAKSWLCHGAIDRKQSILPVGSPEEVEKVSPFEATQFYLEHLKYAWNAKFPEHLLSEQELTVTIPASFDPAARELTAEAATSVGLGHLTLLEEPQAAVYNWVKTSGKDWREQVTSGDIVLVVDIGGGTTDLSLVAVSEEDGNMTLNRIAVGDHILLGGDNMDLALAYRVKAKLAQQGKEIQGWQIQAITQACRDAKETLLVDNDINEIPIVVPSRGSKLLGNTLRTELTRDEVHQTLVEGFFPETTINDRPKSQRRSGLTQQGLPYAQDPAITRHLAEFLSKQHEAASDLNEGEESSDTFADDPMAGMFDPLGSATEDVQSNFIKPTTVLFNGGVLKAPAISERLMSVINQWLAGANVDTATLLDDCNLDLAVASGASYFGYVKQGSGVRIRGGLGSSYYVGIESAMPAIPGMETPIEALCVAPFGMEEGTSQQAGQAQFGLIVGEPVHFRFFGSKTRRHDQAGLQLEHWSEDEIEELPELQVTLPIESENQSSNRKPGEIVPVHLASTVTEVGTLQLEAIEINNSTSNPQRWQIELDINR